MKHIFLIASVATLLLASCKKDKTPDFNSNTKGPLSVEFDNIAGAADLQLTTGVYKNATGENFTVTKLKYYVSNFILTKTDGTVYTVPQDSSYFLIDEADGTEHAPELMVPEGEYKSVAFTIGVDSLRSTKDISQRPGVLDPTDGGADMYWSWNSGYIFFRMEGTSPASAGSGNVFMFHVGGYGGYSTPTINNVRKVTLDLTARGTPQVKAGKATNIHLLADVLKVFTGTANVSIASNTVVMFDPFSAAIANNYTSMFVHDHTEN